MELLASGMAIPAIALSAFVVIIAIVLWGSQYFGPENH